MDVRLILRPNDRIKEIKTNHPIDLILYDNEMTAEVEKLKTSVVNVKSGYRIQSIGEYVKINLIFS